MVLASRSEGPPSHLYGDATTCADLPHHVLIKGEVAPSTAEHHTQEGLTQPPSAPKGVCHDAGRVTDAVGWEWGQTEAPEGDVLNRAGDELLG